MSLRIGLIGFGAMGRNHARVLQATDGVVLAGVADPEADGSTLPGHVPFFEHPEALLAHGIDACVVAAPTSRHESLGLLLAEAGVHTLIEKPLAGDAAAARRVSDAFAARGLVGAVGHIERYNAALQHLHDRLAAGELGEVFQVSSRRIGPYPARIRDAGVVMDLATHDLDATAWLMGADFRSVGARTLHSLGTDHEDLVVVTGHLTDGTITNHLVNWMSPMKERTTTVTGERGTFVADTLTEDLTLHSSGHVDTEWDAIARLRGVSEGEVRRFAISKPEPLAVELAAFRDAVLGEGTDIVTMQAGLICVTVAEAVLHSARTGQTVDLPPPAGSAVAG